MIDIIPELKFIGSGDAFNVELGNTSAYFIFKKTLVLIDCGETVFSEIIKLNLLKNINRVIILITHLHSDHVGSLGTFVAYLTFITNIKPEIYLPNKDFVDYFYSIGLEPLWYQNYIVGTNRDFPIIHDDNDWVKARYIYTDHKSNISSYGILFSLFICETKVDPIFPYYNWAVYYSGDSYNIPNEILVLLINNKLNRIYQDTCSYSCDYNPHMNIEILNQSIPDNYKKYVYCMHIDRSFNIDKAESYGFNVVQNEQCQEKKYSIDEIKAYLLHWAKPSLCSDVLFNGGETENKMLLAAISFINDPTDHDSIEYFLNNSNWKEFAERAKDI